MNSERRLVTIRTIQSLAPIPGADQIECAFIDGWRVVVKRGEFQPGDPCVFFEIDSFLPAEDHRFDFLAKTKRVWRGKEGYRLRTIKLRGQLSQGLALPTRLFPEGLPQVDKWEEDIPPALAGLVAGSFPHFLRRTDQERVQNVYSTIDKQAVYETTVKMDGTSLTVFNHQGEHGVCSRNLRLKLGEENANNLYVQQLPTFQNVPDGYAVQSEICGPGIQSNRAGLDKVCTFVFDVFHIPTQRYVSCHERIEMCHRLGWTHVPLLSIAPCPELCSLDETLAWAEHVRYGNGAPAEGVVYKLEDGSSSFKVISNKFLLHHGL
jgi:RNA ligase (TIGR02306 family)